MCLADRRYQNYGPEQILTPCFFVSSLKIFPQIMDILYVSLIKINLFKQLLQTKTLCFFNKSQHQGNHILNKICSSSWL